MIRSSLRHPTGRSAARVLALVTPVLLWTAGPASADGDLVVKRTALRHPTTPPSAAPSPSPGRDVVVLDPVPSPRPPRVPGELSPAASSTRVEQATARRAWLRSIFEGFWRAFAD